MGDLTKCRSSLDRASLDPAAAALELWPASPEPVSMVSEAALPRGAATAAPIKGFRRRIRRSPLEYSNSSRLCSVMNCKSCSICWISGLANAEPDFEGFLRFMPVLDLDEIPRNAGQYFGSVSVHGHIVFDADTPDSFHVYARFNGDDVAWFQAPLLPPRHSRAFVDFQPEPMAGTVHEESVQTVRCQNLPCGCIDVAAPCSVPDRCNRRRVRFQYRSVATPDAPGGLPKEHRAGYVAAIVAEYNTQVQHHQLIFPQSFGGRTGVRERGTRAEGDDGFKGRPGGSL